MKIGAVIQARTGSTRFPGKILKHLPFGSGVTVLEQVIRRMKRADAIDDIVVATTRESGDEEIVKIAEKEGVKWFRGSQDNVLERFYLAAKENHLDIVVRITSDCPCIDSGVVDFTVKEHNRTNADFTSNCLDRTYPHGLDTEVLSFEALEKAFFEASTDYEKEHVSPYIYMTNPKLFKITDVSAPEDLRFPGIRVTIDFKEDYVLLCAVFDYLYKKDQYFNTEDIINLFKMKPWLKMINEKVIQKKRLKTLDEEIIEAMELLKLQGLDKVKDLLEDHRN